MPLKLHPECKARLVSFLEEQLPSLKVNRRRFVDYHSAASLEAADEILPKGGLLRARLADFIDDHPFFEFAVDSIGRTLLATETYRLESEAEPLGSHDAFMNMSLAAHNIVEAFESLPWSYVHTFQMPKALSEQLAPLVSEVGLSSAIKLIRADDSFISKHPLSTENDRINETLGVGSLLWRQMPEWDKNIFYFQVRADGYVTQYGSAKTSSDAEEIFKSFLGLAISLRLFRRHHAFSSYALKDRVYVHKFAGSKWAIDTKYELNSDFSEVMSQIVLDPLDEIIKDDEQAKKNWVLFNLRKIMMCFANSDKAKRVLSASRWLFDSRIGRNELLAFVQTMVALEILLGDKEKSDLLGLNELLRNRCAYLIGKSQTQRDKILKEFTEIYDVRSQIVHRGKSRLNSRERRQFFTLQWMCARVIHEEVELLEKDVKA